MLKIQNIKTEKTEVQIKSNWEKAKAFKKYLISTTDWTQLPDVNLENGNDFNQWREYLRFLDLEKAFHSPEQAESELNRVETEKPVPIFSQTAKLDKITQLEKEVRELNILVHQLVNTMVEKEAPKLENLSLDQSQKKIADIILKEKNALLIKSGALVLPVMAAQTDQAVDFLSRDQASLSEYSLLYNDSDVSDQQFVQKIIGSFKNKRKELHKIEMDYLQTEQSVYNMSVEEVNNYFIENGHRYRCVESDTTLKDI